MECLEVKVSCIRVSHLILEGSQCHFKVLQSKISVSAGEAEPPIKYMQPLCETAAKSAALTGILGAFSQLHFEKLYFSIDLEYLPSTQPPIIHKQPLHSTIPWLALGADNCNDSVH